jgi:hypothetical protein
LIRPDFWVRESAWNGWAGRCLKTPRELYGWWRTHEGYIYTVASDQRTSSPEQLGV